MINLEVSKSCEHTDTMRRAKLSVEWPFRRKFSDSEHSNPVQAGPGPRDSKKTWIRVLNGIYIETA